MKQVRLTDCRRYFSKKELNVPLKNIAVYLATSKEEELQMLEQHLAQVKKEEERLR